MTQSSTLLFPEVTAGNIEDIIERIRRMDDTLLSKAVIPVLEERGYKVSAPPRTVRDEYTFERAWQLYGKKVGCKAKLLKKWNAMTLRDRKAATLYIPSYVLATPDRQYRKNFQTFLNQRGWEDEIISTTPSPALPPAADSSSVPLGERWLQAQRNGNAADNASERNRILGLVRLVQSNPKSSARQSLVEYYKRGYLTALGITWQP